MITKEQFLKLENKKLLKKIESMIESMIDEPYWHTEEPTEEGSYLIYLDGDCYTTRWLFDDGTWSRDLYEELDIMKMVAWHKIPPYEEQK